MRPQREELLQAARGREIDLVLVGGGGLLALKSRMCASAEGIMTEVPQGSIPLSPCGTPRILMLS